MPYSDNLPAYVIPYDPAWRRRAKMKDWPELDDQFDGMTPWDYCYDFQPEMFRNSQARMVLDKHHEDAHACRRVNPAGVRNHNWCYRCPAGMMHSSLHIYDAARDRDRTMLLY